MAIGDVERVTAGGCSDLSYVDTGMYDTAGYGSVYVLDAERPAIVETGTGAHHDRILDALVSLDIDPASVEVLAVTHVHLDHAGGAGHLARACPNAEVVVHEAGAPHLVDPSRIAEGTRAAVGDLWAFYVDPVPVPESRVRAVADGERVDLGDHQLEVHHVPGHAPHQVIYHDPANEAVFTGDAAGVWVPSLGRTEKTTPPWSFDLEQSLADLRTIRDLDPETLLFSHFGPQSTPEGTLADYGGALREWVEEVDAARAELGDDEAVVDHFVERTEMDAVWDERLARGVAAVDARGALDYLDGRGA
ncbi:MBL fold metallo-hydrolase [Halomarina litorea]|uniref:MBL fold metallo-hydrolase n=1 Tax=Halomarina litorea TaxID=2961595 RepID=UPI0020C4288B|nr:MBL fold metallo-hydrolase [Halomarina sp. BCD28]